MKTHFHPNKYLILAVLVIVTMSACKKFVEIPPQVSSIASSTVYSNDGSAAAAMSSVYSNMIAFPALSSGYPSIGSLMGLASDELVNYDPTNIAQAQFYENALSSYSQSQSNYYFWTELYNEMYVSNAVLAGLENSTGVSTPVKQQLTGEAKFMRAFLLFYATNLYGDVPVVTTTNYLVNNTLSRTPQAQVYQQVIADLRDAQAKLPAGFVDGSGKTSALRVRPNKEAATALLARVYLYQANLFGDATNYVKADSAATSVINNSSQYSLDTLNGVFLGNSTEAIWQLQAINPTNNTYDAQNYVLLGTPSPGGQSEALSNYLLNSFESSDMRYTHWIGSFNDGTNTYYYPYKYKVWQSGDPSIPVTEYTMVLRLAEQYLIRAEARAQQGKLSEAVADLNVIRNRAGLGNYAGTVDQTSILTASLHERQVELFTEWGHRWFDLKRTNNLNTVMGSPGNVCQAKGGTWSPNWALMPIALDELKINHNLKQNPGY